MYRISLFVLVGTLVLAAPGEAQTSASGRATMVVGELLTLRVLEARGSFEEVVRVEVVANRRWQLNVVLAGPEGQSGTAMPIASGGPGRTPLEVDYARVRATAGADAGSTVRLTLSPF